MTDRISPVTETRDFDARPYSPDEQRVAKFLFDCGVGGGDDPIGFILASHAYLAAERNEARRLAQSPDRIQELEQEVAKLRAFAESFHVTVVDNFYKDVTLVLEQPHTLAIRLQNDSTKSWIFADLEDRRKAALSDTSTEHKSK